MWQALSGASHALNTDKVPSGMLGILILCIMGLRWREEEANKTPSLTSDYQGITDGILIIARI